MRRNEYAYQWLLLGLAGVLLIVCQQFFKNLVYIAFGVGLIVTAASGLITWWRYRGAGFTLTADLVRDALLLIAGIWILLNPGRFDRLLNVIIGCVLIVYGVSWLLRTLQSSRDPVTLVLSGITVVLGIVVMSSSMGTSWPVIAAGWYMIYAAVAGWLADRRLF